MKRGLILAVLLALASCKPRLNTSDAKFGFLEDSKENLGHFLISYPNGSTIRICGGYEKMVIWAIGVWGAPIGRSYKVVEDCSTPDIKISPSSNETLKWCAANKLTPPRMVAVTDGHPMSVIQCGDYPQPRLQNHLLHEIGHLFGLCDQYDYDGALENCAKNFGEVEGSVMNAAETSSLMRDDINGIQALAYLYGDKSVPHGPYMRTEFVTLTGSGPQAVTFNPVGRGNVVVVAFPSDCKTPFKGDLMVGAEYVPCRDCNEGDSTYRFRSYALKQVTNIAAVGADLGDGSCSYQVSVWLEGADSKK